MIKRAAACGLVAVFAAIVATAAIAGRGELKPAKGGIVAGDFVSQDLQGKTQRFATYRGKVVLLNFWATWCPPCRKEMPAMEQLYQTYKDKGFMIVAVSQDQAPPATVRSFAEELKLSFTVWHDRDSLVGKQYSVPGVPASYLIGRDGRIAYKVLGEYDWLSPEARAAVEQLITTGGTADEHR